MENFMENTITEEEEEEDTLYGKYLTFALDAEIFGIEIRCVKEIVGIQKISELPEFPYYVKGVINLRGTVIPVVDMRLRMHKTEASYTDRTCIIITDINGTSVGLIVDHVEDVIPLPDDAISPTPDFGFGVHAKYLKGIGKVNDDVRLLIDCTLLFKEDELEKMKQAGNGGETENE